MISGRLLRYSFQAGDNVIARVARRLRDAMTTNADIARATSALEILIVDDDDLACERLETVLASQNMHALSVQSLAAAREAMRAVHFPLVIVDRRLGTEDGATLCREYRARQSGRRVRILMWSAGDTVAEMEAALTAGADEFLSKRAPDAEVLDRVRRLHAVACGKSANVPKQVGDARVRSLHDLAVLDTAAEREFDDIATLASTLCDTPIALISFLDESRQWVKAKVGIDIDQAPREHSICAHAIAEGTDLFVVADTRADDRFCTNPFVTADPGVRFYAGAPLITADGHAIGTVCVIDSKPRTLPPKALECLAALARQVMRLLEQRKQRNELHQLLLSERAAEADLRRSEAILRAAFESASIGMALVSTTGNWLRVNNALCRVLGYTPEELVRTSFQAITHPDDLATDLGFVRDVLEGRIQTYSMHKRYIHKQGHFVPALLSVSLVRDERDVPLYFVAQILGMADQAT